MGTARMTSERRKKLKTLAKLMNKKNAMPVPIVGGVLELMALTARPEDVDFLLKMGGEPHTAEQAAAKTGMPENQALLYLENLVKKGWIWPYFFEDEAMGYELLPIVVGWLELQLCHGRATTREKEFARKTDDVFKSMKKINVFPVRNISNILTRKFAKPYQSIGTIRPPDDLSKGDKVALNRAVAVSPTTVQPTHYVSELVDRHGKDNAIAVVHCFCRQWRRFMDEPCRFDIRPETCIVVGPMAKQIADYDFGRIIEKKDTLNILEETSKAGALHTMFHEKDDTRLPHVAICNCCWDCCGIYGGFNRGLFPLYFQCYYEARRTHAEDCKGCGTCVMHCPTNAIALRDEKAVITLKKCIGCGQCALQCPTNSIELIPSRRNVLVPMPRLSEARIM
jgi:Pyruvate/2-oxoacid:ferredoxin oxidoreductase delta subunit